MPMKNPLHPGDLIRTEIVEALGLNVTRAARILKVRRATLSDLLHGKATLTPEMALRIEKAFGPDMNHSSGCNSPTTWRRSEAIHVRSPSSGTCRHKSTPYGTSQSVPRRRPQPTQPSSGRGVILK